MKINKLKKTKKTEKIEIFIDGMHSSGKKTIQKILLDKYNDKIKILENNNFFREQIKLYWDNWKEKCEISNKTYIIFLECNPEECINKRKSIYSTSKLFYERYKYRQFSCYYGNINLINTSNLNENKITQIIEEIIFNNNHDYLIPKLDSITEENFEKFPIVIDSNSKIIRKYNDKYHIIKLKPNVYSFIKKGQNEILGTEIERMKMTKDIIELISRHEIPHSYYYIGKNYIWTKNLDNEKDISNVEVIVKKYFIGSDKHNYYALEKYKNRFNKNIVNGELNEYNKLLVRFDFRNPDFNPITNQVLGDFTMCDDLSDEFINVEKSKKLVKKTFQIFSNLCDKFNYILFDCCFCVTVNGEEIYAEISQDCIRLRPKNLNELNDEEKKIWSTGGSSENYVLYRYKTITEKLNTTLKKIYFEKNNK